MKLCSKCQNTSYSSCSKYEWACPSCAEIITLSKERYVQNSIQKPVNYNRYKKMTLKVTKRIIDITI